MREVRRAADDPEFLLKALGEASGELYRIVLQTNPGLHREPGQGLDDRWCLHAISYHMVQVERGVHEQIDRIAHQREPRIANVDLDDIPLEADYQRTNIDMLLEEFHYERRRTAYLLWNLYDRDWKRVGVHPYRGEVTITQLVRELYLHDLEHLWQAQRMVGELTAARR